MMRFADKLYSARTRICTCCTTRAHAVSPPPPPPPELPLLQKVFHHMTTCLSYGGVTTPATTPFAGRRLELSPCEAVTSISKRAKTVRTHQSTSEPRMESALRHVLRSLTLFAKQNLNGISELYIDLSNDATTTIFGQRSNDLPGRKYVSRLGFHTNPWCRGVVPCPPQPGVAHLIEQHLLNADGTELAGNFIVHGEPRFIRITGFVIRDQLAGNNIIGHELMSILFRRFDWLDSPITFSDVTRNVVLHLTFFLACSFFFVLPCALMCNQTLVLSDSDFLHTVSIQKQLSADSLKYDLTSAQMLRVINLLDPLYQKNALAPPHVIQDEAAAWKLHSALFACLHEFYAGWPSVKESWRMKHEPTTDVTFSPAESGVCAIHIVR
ncbi:hypothetical protein VPH35_134494 [Triticum aestivum]